jgi:hypothetical protein
MTMTMTVGRTNGRSHIFTFYVAYVLFFVTFNERRNDPPALGQHAIISQEEPVNVLRHKPGIMWALSIRHVTLPHQFKCRGFFATRVNYYHNTTSSFHL